MFVFLKADIIVRINFILYSFRSAKKPQWGSVFERKYSDETGKWGKFISAAAVDFDDMRINQGDNKYTQLESFF